MAISINRAGQLSRQLIILFLFVALMALGASTTSAADVTVTPANPQGWITEGNSGGGSSAITGTAPRDGNGSVEMWGDRTRWIWGVNPTVENLGDLYDVTDFAFDWMVAVGSTQGTTLNYTPALRLHVYDPNAANPLSELIWENAYNGSLTVTQGNWVVTDVTGGNQLLWRWVTGLGITLDGSNAQVNQTLADWQDATWYSSDAVVIGISVGVGSSAGAGYHAFSDNLVLGFNNAPDTFNFEQVPQCTAVCYADAVNGDDANGGTSPADAKKTIQAAIDQVDSGGTVYVLPGTYAPAATILVNKPVTILGPQAGVDPRPGMGSTRDATDATTEAIVTGSGTLSTIIRITASDVTIDGLAVADGNGDLIDSPSNSDISGVTFRYLIIYDAHGDEGIQLRDCDGCVIEFNYIYDVLEDGINLCCGSSNGWIWQNEIRNSHTTNGAIYVYDATDTDIECNVIENVTGNDGIKVDDVETGVPSNIWIRYNTIRNTKQDGIRISNSGVYVIGNEVTGSTSDDGAIYITNNVIDVTVSFNYIHTNALTTNPARWNGQEAGILVGNQRNQTATGIAIYSNNIVGNTPNGVSHFGTGTLAATNNWWGSDDGPGPVATGSGDKVSANVDYANWLTEPVIIQRDYCDIGGTITVEKSAEGAGDLEFTFRVSWDEVDLYLKDGEWETSGLLKPGTYSVEEIDIPEGWVLDEALCYLLEGPGRANGGVSPDEINLKDDDEWFCIFTNVPDTSTPDPAIILTPSYLVSRVVEGQLSGEGSKACYWITLPAEPDGNVVIDIDPNGQLTEVLVSKAQITLNASNWNNLTTANQTNFVCIRAVDDKIDDSGPEQCADKSANMTSDATPYDEECGDHIDYIEHTVNAATTAPGYDQTTPWSNSSLTDLGRPDENFLDVLVVDNDEAAVILTESFAVTDLDEGGSPVGKSCYWVSLASQPTGPVTITIAPDDTEVTTDKTSVVLNATNWNNMSTSYKDNFVCVTPVNDFIIDPPNPQCFTGSASMLGAAGDGALRCGTHLGSIAHSATSADPKYHATSNFIGNGPDFDNDRSTIDVLVRDNDEAGPRFQPGTVNLLEGDQTTFDVSLRSRPSAAVHVTGEDVDLTFQPSNWNTLQQVTITTEQNDTADGPLTKLLQLTMTSADPNFHNVAVEPVEVTIVDDDMAGVFLSRSDIQVSESGQTAAYELVLTAQPKANVTITLLSDGQLAFAPGTVTFSPVNWNQPQAVTVSAVNDQVAEGMHSARVSHQVTSSDGGYAGVVVSDVIVAIGDNDTAAVLVEDATELVVSEDGLQTAAYSLKLQSQPAAAVIVHIDGGGQVMAQPSSVTFTPQNWNQPRAIQLSAIDNTVDEGSDPLAVLTHRATSADPFYEGMEPDWLEVLVRNDDIAGLSLSQAVVTVENGGSSVYSIVLTSRPVANVVIDLVSDGNVTVSAAGCDDEDGTTCVLFTPDNWNQPQTVTVRAGGAGRVEHRIESSDEVYGQLGVQRVMVNASFTLFVPINGRD